MLFWMLLAILWGPSTFATPLSLAQVHENAIGLNAQFLKEKSARLDLDAVIAAYKAGEFTVSQNPVLNFGIGSKPVWIHFSVDNPAAATQSRKLSIETAWLDRVDVYVRAPDQSVISFHAGDEKAFNQRPVNSRYFVFEPQFASGVSDVFIRVNTPDPMVVPIRLMTNEQARTRERLQDLSYGLVYGFLLALIAYNTTLFFSLRSPNYLFYSLYLALFGIMNIAYTGHGFSWLWPEAIRWQQWANPIFMLLYGVSGLFFAIRFLEIRQHFPRLYRFVIGFCLFFGVALAMASIYNSQLVALLIAFTFAFLFTHMMLLLGILSVSASNKPAKYFLLASVSAMVGAALTTLATSGFIPYSSWVFRAVEIGMLIDATLLALALSYQFRTLQEAKFKAEQQALLDPLTGLNNRRAFYKLADPLWSTALRKDRQAAIISIDIDHFKLINDTHGHIQGDETLIAIAEALKASIRQSDVLARWGGEEFIVYMPETSLQEAVAMAERLRETIADMPVRAKSDAATVTASFGVAQKTKDHMTLDALISAADRYLYQAKQQGRDQVCHELVTPAPD